MINDEGVIKLFEQSLKLWIEPEIAKRKRENKLPSDFKIDQCLIRLPQNSPPIVEFNQEGGLIARVKVRDPESIKKGDPVYLHQIERIETVEPPTVNGEKVAFIYLKWTGKSYQIIFDFAPNIPNKLVPNGVEKVISPNDFIARSLQGILTEKVIIIHDKYQKLLEEIGLWAVPSLLPYPLSLILEYLQKNDKASATKLLIEYCNFDFLETLIKKWWDIKEFENRKSLIQDALFAHKEKKYRLSIPAVLPHLEGIITDWIHTQLPEAQIPWRQESKTKKFRDLILENSNYSYAFQRIIESAIEFIVSGPVLETFNIWINNINKAFPNRHAIEHGKYDEDIYVEENSIKLFLLLDTVYHIIISKDN